MSKLRHHSGIFHRLARLLLDQLPNRLKYLLIRPSLWLLYGEGIDPFLTLLRCYTVLEEPAKAAETPNALC